MTVCVDPLQSCLQSDKWRWGQSAHLVVDDGNLDALHTFAEMMRLRRGWFQAGPYPHYDLSPNKHRQAINLGARQITRREMVDLVKAHRQEGSI